MGSGGLDERLLHGLSCLDMPRRDVESRDVALYGQSIGEEAAYREKDIRWVPA